MKDNRKSITVSIETDDAEKKLDVLIEKANKLKVLLEEVKELSNTQLKVKYVSIRRLLIKIANFEKRIADLEVQVQGQQTEIKLDISNAHANNLIVEHNHKRTCECIIW